MQHDETFLKILNLHEWLLMVINVTIMIMIINKVFIMLK